MKSQSEQLEKRRLLKVARDYTKRGYKVTVEPGPNDLPSFLTGFRPDLIAQNETESVVVEVKTYDSLSKSDYIDALAATLEAKPSWRFELVVTNPKNRILVNPEENRLLGITEVIDRCEEAFDLFRRGSEEAAVLLMWSAIEAALRNIAAHEKVSLEKEYPAYVTKKLFSLGLLDKDQYETLQEGIEARNAIAHGYKPGTSKRGITARLFQVAKQIVSQHEDSFKLPSLVNERQLSGR